MIEKLKKISRSIKREYERDADLIIEPTVGIFVAAGLGGVIGIIISVSAAAVGAAIAAIGVGVLRAGVVKKENKECIENTLADYPASGHSCMVIGNKGYVHGLQSTQMVINSLTMEFRAAVQLPPKVEAEVQDFLRDAAEFAAHVRVYEGGQEQGEIVFTRDAFDAQGKKTMIPVGAVTTQMGLMAQQSAAPAAPVPPAPAQQGIKVLKPLQYTKKPQKTAVP